MSVKVLLFASLKEKVGESEIDWKIGKDATVETLSNEFFEKYTGAANLKNIMFYAVNRSAVETTQKLKDGDEVAFLPPVSGG